jgi:hypothetical protein
VAAKLAAMVTALAILTGVPLLILLVGTALGAEDVLSSLGEELRELPGIVGNALLHAILFAVLGLAVAAHTPRRAYATGGHHRPVPDPRGRRGHRRRARRGRAVAVRRPAQPLHPRGRRPPVGVRRCGPRLRRGLRRRAGHGAPPGLRRRRRGLGALVAWRYRRLET